MIVSKAKYYGTPKSLLLLRVFTYLVVASLLSYTLASQRYCGENLSAAMTLVCYNGFNSKPVKRYLMLNNSMDFDDDDNSLANDIINLNFTNTTQSLKYSGLKYTDQSLVISLPSHNLSGIMTKLFKGKRMAMTQTRRRRFTSSGGIHSECCLKKCTISEMRGYCL